MQPKDLNPKLRPVTEEILANMEKGARTLTILEEKSGLHLWLTSGLRTYYDQLRINPRNMGSAHQTGEGWDFWDPDSRLYDFLFSNEKLCEELGLYVELKKYSGTHTHIQMRPTRARYFIP